MEFNTLPNYWGYVDPDPFQTQENSQYRVILCQTQKTCEENTNRIYNDTDDTNCSPISESNPVYFSDGLYIEGSLILGLTFGLLVALLIRFLHYGYFLYRRYKYGEIINAEITKKEISKTKHKGNTNSTSTYFVKYQYNNICNHNMYTNRLVYNYCRNQDDGHTDYIPDGIMQLIIEYLGIETITFEYGPFKNREQVGRREYNAECIEIRYDPKYPKNCKSLKNENIAGTTGCYVFCGVVFIPAFIYLMYIFFDVISQIIRYDDHISESLSIIIPCIIVLVTLEMMLEDYKYGLLCFRKKIMGELHCIIAEDTTEKVYSVGSLRNL